MLILLVAQNAANTFFYNNENAANTTPVVGYLHAYNISVAPYIKFDSSILDLTLFI
jgi:hypothetical protein